MAAVGSEQMRARREARCAAAAWALLGLALVSYALSAWAGGASGPACEPVGFTVAGGDAMPKFAMSELAVAMQEIHERTGLTFELQPAGGPQSRLSVSWTTDGARDPGSAVVGAGGGTSRRLGYGSARWRLLPGGRELIDGVVEVNGDVAWRHGLDVDDGLAAVFVHELGHVVGLPHSADAASFMHESTGGDRPTWTEAEVAELAWIGRQAGCQPASLVG